MITNKNEWKNVLSKALKTLPADERRRVLEYYDELFADRIDDGQREADILAALGDPNDAAGKILADYDAYLGRDENPEPKEPDGQKEPTDMSELRRGGERTFETETDKRDDSRVEGNAVQNGKSGFSNSDAEPKRVEE